MLMDKGFGCLQKGIGVCGSRHSGNSPKRAFQSLDRPSASALWPTRMSGAAVVGPYWTSRAALRMKEATTDGIDNIATWLDGSVMDVAFIRSANIACSVGETTRS